MICSKDVAHVRDNGHKKAASKSHNRSVNTKPGRWTWLLCFMVSTIVMNSSWMNFLSCPFLLLSPFLGTFLIILRKEMRPYIRSALVVIGLLLLQTSFLPFISLGGYLPDLFILYLVFTALRRGQIEATISGMGVTSTILLILKPRLFNERTADSRPGPGPLIITSRFFIPNS